MRSSAVAAAIPADQVERFVGKVRGSIRRANRECGAGGMACEIGRLLSRPGTPDDGAGATAPSGTLVPLPLSPDLGSSTRSQAPIGRAAHSRTTALLIVRSGSGVALRRDQNPSDINGISAKCHAEGRGLESLQPLAQKAPLTWGFCWPRSAGSALRQAGAADGRRRGRPQFAYRWLFCRGLGGLRAVAMLKADARPRRAEHEAGDV